MCKACAGVGTKTMAATRDEMRGGSGGEGDETPVFQSRFKSRYRNTAVARQRIKRAIVVLLLLVGGLFAYLPFISAFLVDDTLGDDGYIGMQHAPTVVLLAGRVHMLYGRDEEGIKIFEKGIEKIAPENQAKIYFYMARAYKTSGNIEYAAKLLTEYLERWPKHGLAIEAAAELADCEKIMAMRRASQDDRPNVLNSADVGNLNSQANQ